jgi:1-phosphatidylinositol-4-phosphate 5-kinase
LIIGIGYFLDQYSRKLPTSSAYVQREKFPAIGGVAPPHSQPDFDIEAYGLDTFCALMNIYGISPDTLRRHICEGELKEIVNPSSSGSLLYLTSDSTYLVKTVRDYDAKFIQQKFLQEYYQYVRQTPGTFLAKLFGVYGYIPYISQQRGITIDSFTLRFAIFSNVIPTNIDIHEKYDLKGSSYKRDANFNERIKSSATFKDNDFREINPQGLKIPKEIYYNLKEILTSDAEFLEKLNIMDYSLLLGKYVFLLFVYIICIFFCLNN